MPLHSRHLMPDGLNYTLAAIRRHHLVVTAELEEQAFYKAIVDVKRRRFYPRLKVYIADVYILTVSDVNEIMEAYPEVNSIVVISNWDHYTNIAKEEARINGIGVFTLAEFLEALNYRGKEFLDTGVARKTE